MKKIVFLFLASLFVSSLTSSPANSREPERSVVIYEPARCDFSIHFAVRSVKIRKAAKPILDNTVAYMKSVPEMTVTFHGYADALEDPLHAMALSERRAQVVKDYFISKGIDASRMKIKGYGSTQPWRSNDTEAGRAENRVVYCGQ